jgi:transposase InsO family protein
MEWLKHSSKRLRETMSHFSDPFDALTLMKQLPDWFDDFNEHAPHKGLNMMAPRQFIRRL